MATGHKTYLIEGNIAKRTAHTLHENVECPSLSPDGTRIAYKELVQLAPGTPRIWHLHVLDLRTMRDIALAEPGAIDDQAEWLGNRLVVYGSGESIRAVRADGTGQAMTLITAGDSPGFSTDLERSRVPPSWRDPRTSGSRSSQPQVRVFAAQGYEASRVGDIAKEAGVAYGLVYHYFGSKTPSSKRCSGSSGETPARGRSGRGDRRERPEQLGLVVKIVLRAWRDDPDLVRLLVREITRSLTSKTSSTRSGRASRASSASSRGQEEGTFRTEIDARVAAFMLYGALEEVLTGWVLGRLRDDADGVAAAEREVIERSWEGFGGRPTDDLATRARRWY